jgi:hypothetical protein
VKTKRVIGFYSMMGIDVPPHHRLVTCYRERRERGHWDSPVKKRNIRQEQGMWEGDSGARRRLVSEKKT